MVIHLNYKYVTILKNINNYLLKKGGVITALFFNVNIKIYN